MSRWGTIMRMRYTIAMALVSAASLVGMAVVGEANADTGDASDTHQYANDGQYGDVIAEGIRKDGVRRIISYISNADEEMAHSPTPDRARYLAGYKEHAQKAACDLWKQVDTRNLDADIRAWGARCAG